MSLQKEFRAQCWRIRFLHAFLAAVVTVGAVPLAAAAEPPTAEEVDDGIVRAAKAFSGLSYKGGYPFMVSADLQVRYDAGHGVKNPFPDETYITIEPPGTPSVGRTFLRAYRATGDEQLLDMAKEVGDALATVQLDVGGWRMRQPLSDEWTDRHVDAPHSYRRPPQADFDDARTQGPTMFFIELIRDGSDEERHKEALDKALNLFLEAQYPSGGWPQYYPLETEDGHSDLDNYRRYHHINDASIPDCMEVLLYAYETFGEDEHFEAFIRAADWLLEVRLPDAAWAQQYHDDFVKGPKKPNSPAPGRWFEPMAITAGETPAVLDILKEVWLKTGDDRYVEPFDEVADWYERSRLEDGRWARFYELHTNRPLYCTPDRVITYSDEDLRPGYAWKGNWGQRALRTIERVKESGRNAILEERAAEPDDEAFERLGRRAREALDALDERGFWLEERSDAAERPTSGHVAVSEYDGREDEFISAGLFNRRMKQLTDYLKALQAREQSD